MPDDPAIAADLLTASYDYRLPPELIAQRPADRRDESRLMLVRHEAPIGHATFRDLPSLLRPGDLLVANDGRVLRARFAPRRRKGGRAEVLLLHPAAEPGTWEAMVRPGKRVRPGDRLTLAEGMGIEIVDRAPGGTRIVRFFGIDADAAMTRFGRVPLPPYIDTPPPDADERYQTVYAAHDGSAAAPTAGLHFTDGLIAEIKARGIGWTTLTLDVGAGTFRPVAVEDIRQHALHAERYEIPESTSLAIERTRADGGRVVAVGTTALRALETSASEHGGRVVAWSGKTTIFIHPPQRIRAVDALLTNFHLPRSTLLMLVAALAGRERILAAYAEAVRERYRFYSFGDAMLVEV